MKYEDVLDGKLYKLPSQIYYSRFLKVGRDNGIPRDIWKFENGEEYFMYNADMFCESWKLKPEEKFIWGACDDDGMNFLFSGKPSGKDEDGSWMTDSECMISEKWTFPKDKPQKYILVPFEDYHKNN